MMRTLVMALVGALALLGAEARAQQPAPAYTPEQLALAREVIVLSGAEEMVQQMMRTMAPQLADQIVATGASREVATRFTELFIEEFVAEGPRIVELSSISYASAFTLGELQDLRAFYQSPTGRKWVAVTPQMTEGLTRAGTLIGEEVAQRAIQRLQAELARPPANP